MGERGLGASVWSENLPLALDTANAIKAGDHEHLHAEPREARIIEITAVAKHTHPLLMICPFVWHARGGQLGIESVPLRPVRRGQEHVVPRLAPHGREHVPNVLHCEQARVNRQRLLPGLELAPLAH